MYFPRPHEDRLYYHSAIAVNGHLYVSHGRDEEKSFYKFDPCAARWDPINFHHASIQCSLVYLDGWIYALGGKYHGKANDTFVRRYNIRDDKEEVLYPEYETITFFTTAVAYLGKILVYSKESPVDGESKFTLSVYDPVINKWFVVFKEQHRVHGGRDAPLPRSCWNIALVVHENKCYRVFYEDIGSQREGWVKTRVNELVFDFKSETPSCRLGESQEQFGFTELLARYSDTFCISGEVYMLVNRYPLRTGHRMTPNEDVDLLKRKWEPLYLFLDEDSAVTHYTFDVNLFE